MEIKAAEVKLFVRGDGILRIGARSPGPCCVPHPGRRSCSSGTPKTPSPWAHFAPVELPRLHLHSSGSPETFPEWGVPGPDSTPAALHWELHLHSPRCARAIQASGRGELNRWIPGNRSSGFRSRFPDLSPHALGRSENSPLETEHSDIGARVLRNPSSDLGTPCRSWRK